LYSDRFWTLDPIDGTKGFLRKEQFAIALALVIRGQVELAVLGCPNLPFPGNPAPGTLAWAIRGHGAWRQALDLPQSAASRIRVSGVAAASELRVCESVESGHSAHDWSALVASTLQLHRPAVRMDSQCKYAVVAAGEADAYIRLPTRKGYQEKIWDHAAGVLLVEEAGGTVTDILGRKLDWTLGATLAVNSGVVATSGQCHPEVLMAIAQHRPAELA
jgi:3'(2'), 5'-bisphosphate nucleotidase